MRPSPGLSLWIVSTCSALLLVAQVLGLHFHRHVERHGDAIAHAAELHFEGGGLHVGDTHADHGHEPAADGGSTHWHLDVESKSLKAGLAKAFFDSLLLPLLWLVAALVCAAVARTPIHSRRVRGPTRSRPYRLRPPSQAPPAIPVLA